MGVPGRSYHRFLMYAIMVVVLFWWIGILTLYHAEGQNHPDPQGPVIVARRQINPKNKPPEPPKVTKQLTKQLTTRSSDEIFFNLPLAAGEVMKFGKVRTKSLPVFPNVTKPKHCEEKVNLVYIKMIKCASQTLVNIFRKFGLERRLSFVTTLAMKLYLGWPWPIQDNFHRPSKTGGFNILCDHSILDETAMSRIMPPDTIYITSLREPYSQFKSMFHYYGFQRILNLTDPDPLSQFLLDHARYEAEYVSPERAKARFCIPSGLHMSRNLMAYNLGFPTGFVEGQTDQTNNQTFIQSYLEYLDQKLDLVLLVEYFHESLILLKRKMCWQLSDVIYLSKNVGSYNYKNKENATLVSIYRQWSAVDYQLYDRFNKSFWRQVDAQSSDFRAEVENLNSVIKDVSLFCTQTKLHDKQARIGRFALDIMGTVWNKPFEITTADCETLDMDLMYRVHRMWDFTYPDMPQPRPDRNFC